MFFLVFFLFNPLRLKYSRTASFLTSHRLMKYENLHPRSLENGAKTLQPFEGKLQVFISYLCHTKTMSMLYNSSLFQFFLQLVSTIFCFRDMSIQVWQAFRQTFCFQFQIQVISSTAWDYPQEHLASNEKSFVLWNLK